MEIRLSLNRYRNSQTLAEKDRMKIDRTEKTRSITNGACRYNHGVAALC